uniref:Uncharacterized protein n=1 Tax=Oryza rufipogon TaxID=4529 RepID=A0A0E0NI11_ORYRU
MAIPVANSSITSLFPGVAWEATIRPPLSPTSLLLLTVARAAAGKAAWPQGWQRQGSPRLLALGRSREPPGAATAVTAKPAPFRPDLAGWLATGKEVGTGDGGGRGELHRWSCGYGGGDGDDDRAAVVEARIRRRRDGRWWAAHTGIPRLPLAFSDASWRRPTLVVRRAAGSSFLPKSGASLCGDGVD